MLLAIKAKVTCYRGEGYLLSRRRQVAFGREDVQTRAETIQVIVHIHLNEGAHTLK